MCSAASNQYCYCFYCDQFKFEHEMDVRSDLIKDNIKDNVKDNVHVNYDQDGTLEPYDEYDAADLTSCWSCNEELIELRIAAINNQIHEELDKEDKYQSYARSKYCEWRSSNICYSLLILILVVAGVWLI